MLSRLVLLNQQAIDQHINISTFIDCLYCYASRCLYSHSIDMVYLLLLAITQLKTQNPGLSCQYESILVDNMLKFCQHYENHPSYCLLGYACILLLVYGDPCSDNYTSINGQSASLMIDHNYYLAPLVTLLQN